MSLAPGDKLGPYEIIEAIGKGGMGEVFRARDPRLGRDVAIKVSAEKFGERFTREARAIAALNHPNICTLHDVGDNYLVMELVEGDAPKGPMGLDEAVAVMRQVADALEAAHEKGIVHRDLKPGNIKVTPEGVVKVLDFGLAKVGPRAISGGDDVEASPTISMHATQAGVILGTAAYMAPEQAKGKPVDKRADIWAFGVVFYELLTGKRLFQGEDLTEVLASVVKEQADLSLAPSRARRLLARCLEKDPKKRLRDISAVGELLEEETPEPAQAKAYATWLPWGVAAGIAVGAAVASYGWWSATRPEDKPLVRVSVDLGPEAVRGSRTTAVLSPDGTRIVYLGSAPGGLTRLFTRRLDQAAATPLTGSESASDLQPFFSPDGQWIGFHRDGVLMKVSVQGGAPSTLVSAAGFVGASWGSDGNILFGSLAGVWSVPEAGGAGRLLVEPKVAAARFFPHVLPGAKAVLFSAAQGVGTNLDDWDISVQILPDGEVKTLLHGGHSARYIPTGHIVYVREGKLWGVAFDASFLALRGAPVPLAEDVAADNGLTGGGQFSVSDSGTLVYLSGSVLNSSLSPQWLDAAGRSTPLIPQTGRYSTPRLSPDGQRLAYTATGSKGADVWIHDLARSTSTQITFTGPGVRELAWSPDSKHVVFGDGAALWWIAADGSGQPLRILDKVNNPRPTFIGPGGLLLYAPASDGGLPDTWTLPMDLSDPERPKTGKAEPFLADPAIVEVDPAFSPDGKFVAYASNESGVEDVYVRPFPGPGGKWKISTSGGKFPVFARATRQLFYLGGDDRIWVADYTIQGGAFSAGQPRAWSPVKIFRDGVRQSFDISADGKRAVVFPAPVAETRQGNLHATFLFNFFDEVRRRVPAGK